MKGAPQPPAAPHHQSRRCSHQLSPHLDAAAHLCCRWVRVPAVPASTRLLFMQPGRSRRLPRRPGTQAPGLDFSKVATWKRLT